MKRDAVTRIDGAVYTHRVLMHTAKVFLEKAQESELGSYHNALTSTVFAWLAFEAYLNAVIEHLDPATFRVEQQFFTRKSSYPGVNGKLRWVLDRLKVTPSGAAERRRRSLVQLHRLRNQLVHAKPVRYSGTFRHPLSDDPPMFEKAWVEAQVTPARARRYVAAVKDFSEWLHSRIKPKFADPHMRRYAFEGTLQSQTRGTSAVLRK